MCVCVCGMSMWGIRSTQYGYAVQGSSGESESVAAGGDRGVEPVDLISVLCFNTEHASKRWRP